MLGFLPVEWAVDELPERLVGGNRDQQPVGESGEAKGDETRAIRGALARACQR